MKAGNAILDADMATLGRWARQAWAWWSGELRAMLPPALRHRSRQFSAVVRWHGPGNWEAEGQGPPVVLIAPALCLERRLDLPAMSEADRSRMLDMEADQMFPIDRARLVIAAAADPAHRGTVTVAALPLETAQALAADMAAAGLVPVRVGLVDAQQPGILRIDLTGALRGLMPLSSDRAVLRSWWAVVALLMCCNAALLIWRDSQATDRLQALVDSQEPAVRAARIITHRIATAGRQAGEVGARRRDHDALGVLAATSRALPAQSWVQYYAWDGDSVRITGYRRPEADVVAALRRSGRFTRVRLAGTETIAAGPAGIPFDVSAATGRAGR